MKARYTTILAILIGIGASALAVQGLHAQAKKAPIYVVTEVDVKNADPYLKEYVPRVQALLKKSGGRNIAAGGKVTSFEGQATKPRVAISIWDSMEQYQAYRNSAEYKELRKIGEKYATFRAFAVEGLPQ
jgi:uncharacterized protein (DUF1330 family)